MKTKKVKFWTGDIETGRGFSGKFLIGGVFDGKKYHSFSNEDDFMYFILGLDGTIFFHYLDFDIRTILAWCIKHDIEPDTMPKLSQDKRIIEWKICGVLFRDSFTLTQASLSDLAKSFNLKTRKIPMASHYFTRITPKIRRYLRNDVVSLYEALTSFYRFVGWENFKKHTLASIAMGKFKEIDYSAFERITESPIYDNEEKFIRRALFSGYFATFEADVSGASNIYKLDINSYYAMAMRDNLFPWGGTSDIEDPSEIAQKIAEGEDLGIIQGKAVIPPGLSVGFLPRKRHEGTDYPIQGTIKGCWTTPEILFAQKIGYTFEFQRGIFWQFKDRLFSKYVGKIGKIKERTKGAKRTIAKKFLVSLYGKFAERRMVSVLRRVKDNPIRGHRYIDDRFSIYEDSQYIRKSYSHPEIAVFTTAYARMMLYRFCGEVGWENIYTIISDSIIFRGDLTRSFRKKWIHANKIGKFKVVSHVKKAIILARGVYALKDVNGDETVRNQGGMSEFNRLLTFADFEKIKSNDKKVWVQYKTAKKPNTVYTYLTGRGKLKGHTKTTRKITIKNR